MAVFPRACVCVAQMKEQVDDLINPHPDAAFELQAALGQVHVPCPATAQLCLVRCLAVCRVPRAVCRGQPFSRTCCTLLPSPR